MTRFRLATHETFASLRSRNFRLFFGGQLVSQVGNWLTMVAMTLLVLKLTDNSGVAIGFIVAAQFAPVLLFGAWGGLIADRSDKRKLLIIVQTVAMLQSFALAFLAFMPETPLVPLYFVAAVGGFTTAFDNPARRAFVTELVPEADVNNAVSLNSALMTSARVVGPALAGLLVVTVGFGWAFLADALSYVAVIGALWLIDPKKVRRAPVAAKAKGQVREGLRYVRTVPELWIPLVMMAIIGTLAFNFTVVVPLFAEGTLGGDTTTFTLLMSVLSVGSLVGALSVARRKRVTVRNVIVSATLFGGAMLAFAASPTLLVAFPVAVLVGFGSISFLTASTAIVQVEAAPMMRGRVLALQAIVFLGSTPIGGPILGWVSDAWGARVGIVVGGAACLVAAGFGLVVGRRVLGDGGLVDDRGVRVIEDELTSTGEMRAIA